MKIYSANECYEVANVVENLDEQLSEFTTMIYEYAKNKKKNAIAIRLRNDGYLDKYLYFLYKNGVISKCNEVYWLNTTNQMFQGLIKLGFKFIKDDNFLYIRWNK